MCSRLYYLGLCKYTFAQRRNRLTTHFSERIPVVKRPISVLWCWLQFIPNVLGAFKCRSVCVAVPPSMRSILHDGLSVSSYILFSSAKGEVWLLSKHLKIKIYRTIILPVVLYGCDTWSLTLREKGKLRVSENMVLRRIFGPRRDEVTEEWRRLHNEELNDLYSSPNIVRVIKSRRIRWAGHVARMGEERGCIGSLWGKPEGRRPLGKPRRRWVDNIRMDLQQVGCGYMDWIGLTQERDRWRTLVSAVMNLRVP